MMARQHTQHRRMLLTTKTCLCWQRRTIATGGWMTWYDQHQTIHGTRLVRTGGKIVCRFTNMYLAPCAREGGDAQKVAPRYLEEQLKSPNSL